MKELVQNAISERLKGFRDYKSLLSQYKTELDTNKGYNGRQLLEMFQNCEDEGAKKVKINFDTENCLLEISNDGKRTFSLDGYDSLLYPGLSSKVSSGYIGNKGLGFRSIVNWAKEINIISNGFIVEFKEEYKKDTLLNILGFTEGDLDVIRKKRNLRSTVYPIPLLNCAKVKDLDFEHPFTTTVSIKYDKNFEEDIKKQLEDISPMTLLFLKNIDDVEIVGDVINSKINVKRNNDIYGQVVNYLDNIYYVISDEGEIDQELSDNNDSIDAKRYSVKIAFSKDLSLRDNVLYNYFKTQIPFELPFVAHASLELDQNRNHSTESPVNPFVLQKLFELHLKLVEILKQRNVKSWLPYLAIDNDTFNVYQPYSDLINGYWDDFEVFPAISGYYYNCDDINTLGNDIAYFIEENGLGAELESQVIFCDIEISALKYVGRNSNHKLAIENLASQLNYAKRAQLIKLVLNSYPKERFNVLIDDKGDLISSDKYVYTDKTSGNDDIRVPSYSDICFIHPLLYRELLRELELKGESQNVSRMLKDKLEHISDVHSFEPQVVLRKIIGETNEVLQRSNIDTKTVIREFYSVLLHNYNIRGEIPKLDYNSKIPCLNRKGEVVDVRNLVMSNEFSVGKISEKIFDKSLYDLDDIIAPVSEFGLIGDGSYEAFFEWLGLQKFFIIDEIEENLYPAYREYINDIHDVSISSYKLYNLRSFDGLVKKFTINQVIVWLSIDDKVKSIFADFTKKSSGYEQLIYRYRGLRHIYSFSNLIFFIIERAFNISCYLITSKREEWFNPFKIDYEYLKANNQSLTKAEVDRILRFFGAKDDFNKLNIDYLRGKTQELAVGGNPRGAQLFYKNLVGHYRFNKQNISGVDLFANEGGQLVVRPASEVYYSDRILLPENLTQKYPVFYYPSRSGGMAAIEAFGLNDLNDLDLDIYDFQINTNILGDFDKLLKEIKPFILAFRMDGISKEDVKRSQVVKLNSLKINCCSHINCSINDNLFLIERFNYVYNNGEYYILIPEDLTINDLKGSKEFINNLSDIYLKLFDTSDEKKAFENIIRQSREDNIFDVNNDLAEGVLEEALTLLGEISMRLSIWKGIFRVKEIDIPNDINDRNLDDFIFSAFPILENQELFNDMDLKKEIIKIRKIFLILEVDLEIFNSYADLNISFDHLFQEELESYYNLKKKTLRNQLWHSISKKDSDQQKEFLGKLLIIESLLDGIKLDKNLSNYDFDEIIYRELNKVFPDILFQLNSNSFEDYDLVQIQNDKQFSHEDLQLLKTKSTLESLKYFSGNLDRLTYELDLLKKDLIIEEEKGKKKSEFTLNDVKVPLKVTDFDIELRTENKLGSYSSEPWLGGFISGLSNSGKKKLGSDVESLVFNYLKNLDYCSEVDHVSKTHEGMHYDIRYVNTIDKVTKYVECKYYNGTSFYLSGEEKKFADNHIDQYELWLVDNDLKIYVIKDLRILGDLQAVNYRVNLILKEQEKYLDDGES